MKGKAQEFMLGVYYLAFIVSFLISIFENLENPWPQLIASGILLGSFTIRNFYLYEIEKYKNKCKVIILLEIALIFFIYMLDKGSSAVIYSFVILSDGMLTFSIQYGLLSMAIGYIFYILSVAIKFNFRLDLIISSAVIMILPYAGVFAVTYIVKYFLKQNQFIEKTLKELTVKTLEQEMLYNELKQAYEKLEDMTVLKERNRIAREIHDVVGHTLTTVIVEMEAGKMLLDRDKTLAMEKYALAQQQAKKGLKDLRESVKVLEVGKEMLDFVPSLKCLIQDTEKHADVIIRASIDEFPELEPSIKKTIYRALQEGLTNGIKHGKSTTFVFKLLNQKNRIQFSLEDNGCGSATVHFGFGLKAMRERVKEQGGSFKIESDSDNGFGIYIDIPY